MVYQTIVASDLKWLQSSTSRAWLVLPGLAAFLTVMCLFHLYMASSWAELAGLTFFQALRGWLNDIKPEQQYSGIYLKAMEQFDVAGMMLAVAVFTVIFSFLYQRERQHKARLLAVVAGHERTSSQA